MFGFSLRPLLLIDLIPPSLPALLWPFGCHFFTFAAGFVFRL